MRLFRDGKRGESGTWLPCDPHLPDAAEIFKTQLRALFRASAYGKIAIMYPMITSVGEVSQIKAIVEEVKASLAEQGIEYGNPEQGIMIETPAAAIISDELAKEVDFLQYRNERPQSVHPRDRPPNTKLDPFFDPHHPAILRMIQMVVENAHKAGIWAGICGELGADQELTKEFLAMGVDELSVSPGSILPLRKIILETNVAEYKAGKEMLTQQRHEIILKLLKEKGSITVTEVRDLLDTSESTYAAISQRSTRRASWKGIRRRRGSRPEGDGTRVHRCTEK